MILDCACLRLRLHKHASFEQVLFDRTSTSWSELSAGPGIHDLEYMARKTH